MRTSMLMLIKDRSTDGRSPFEDREAGEGGSIPEAEASLWDAEAVTDGSAVSTTGWSGALKGPNGGPAETA